MEHEISKTRSKKNHPLKYHKETTKKQKKDQTIYVYCIDLFYQ